MISNEWHENDVFHKKKDDIMMLSRIILCEWLGLLHDYTIVLVAEVSKKAASN